MSSIGWFLAASAIFAWNLRIKGQALKSNPESSGRVAFLRPCIGSSQRVDVRTMEFGRPLEEPTAIILQFTAFAFLNVDILPVGNGLSSIFPEFGLQHAELVVINRHVHRPPTQDQH